MFIWILTHRVSTRVVLDARWFDIQVLGHFLFGHVFA